MTTKFPQPEEIKYYWFLGSFTSPITNTFFELWAMKCGSGFMAVYGDKGLDYLYSFNPRGLGVSQHSALTECQNRYEQYRDYVISQNLKNK